MTGGVLSRGQSFNQGQSLSEELPSTWVRPGHFPNYHINTFRSQLRGCGLPSDGFLHQRYWFSWVSLPMGGFIVKFDSNRYCPYMRKGSSSAKSLLRASTAEYRYLHLIPMTSCWEASSFPFDDCVTQSNVCFLIPPVWQHLPN